MLFNYEAIENKVVEQEAPTNGNRTFTKEEKIVHQIEKFIMDLKFKFFYETCITDHHFRDKRSTVDDVLVDMARRQLLYQGADNKSFFTTGRVSSVKTYLKFIPTADDEPRFRNTLLNPFKITYDEYINNF